MRQFQKQKNGLVRIAQCPSSHSQSREMPPERSEIIRKRFYQLLVALGTSGHACMRPKKPDRKSQKQTGCSIFVFFPWDLTWDSRMLSEDLLLRMQENACLYSGNTHILHVTCLVVDWASFRSKNSCNSNGFNTVLPSISRKNLEIWDNVDF